MLHTARKIRKKKGDLLMSKSSPHLAVDYLKKEIEEVGALHFQGEIRENCYKIKSPKIL